MLTVPLVDRKPMRGGKMRIFRSAAAVVGFLGGPLALSGCTASPVSPSEAPVPVETVHFAADYRYYDSVAELTADAEAIVRGVVLGSRQDTLKYLETDPNSSDPMVNPDYGIPESEKEPEAPIYTTVSKLRITEVVSGPYTVGQEIEVSQLGGTFDGVSYVSEDVPPIAGLQGETLLFLRYNDERPATLLNPPQAIYQVSSNEAIEAVSDENDLELGTIQDLEAVVEEVAPAG